MTLSASEERIFTAIATAMVGAEDGEHVSRAIEPFLSRMPWLDRLMLSVLLRLIEYGPLFFIGRLQRFSELDQDKREACLRGWMESWLMPLRIAGMSLKVLSMVGYYGHEAAWESVGYDGPWLGRMDVRVLPASDLRAPAMRGDSLSPGVTEGRTLRQDLTIRAQVCIIGTGAGGAAAAARLADRGVDVIAVEAGGYHTAEDFTQRELEMLPMLFQEAGLRATADKAIGILQGRGVGGSTLHNTGLVYPTPPGIAERWRHEHGFALDEKTLEQYVSEAISELRAAEIPEDHINANNAVLRRGADALGWRYQKAMHNREECCGCGYCMLGCAYNRKYNAALSWLPRAVNAGARILSDARAEQIEGQTGARRVVCRLTDGYGTPTGHRLTIEAPIVIVAAGALDTPALLQRSRVGNGRVGRGLRLHPSPVVAAVFPEPIQAWRGLPQSIILEEFASFCDDGYGGFLLIPSGSNWPALSAIVAPGFGSTHRAGMRRLPHVAATAVLLHDETEGRVIAAPGSGRPLAHYWPNSADMKELQRGIRAAAHIYLAAGAEEVTLPYAGLPAVTTEAELDDALEMARPVRHRISINAVHPQGSCPLGENRRASATDPHGELWDEHGIFVADTSLFPTSVGIPPQVTTMALACAAADYVADGRVA